MIAQSADAVAFTGAGISTECGIPDFRSPDSAWKRHPPGSLRSIPLEPGGARGNVAAQVRDGRCVCGRTSRAADIARSRGSSQTASMSAIITQNIDGLHEAAGVAPDNIIELHGNGTYAACLECGSRHELPDIRRYFERTQAPPECECGGFIKSATIAFGQAMPQVAMRRAREATLRCDLFIAIGSSLVVYPAAGISGRGQGERRRARHRQPRANAARCIRRPCAARRHRRRAGALRTRQPVELKRVADSSTGLKIGAWRIGGRCYPQGATHACSI